MNRSYLTPLVIFIGSFVFLHVISFQCFAATFSGRVVDETGTPISGIKLALIPVEKGNGGWFPILENDNRQQLDLTRYNSESDSKGRFTITNPDTPVKFTLLPYNQQDRGIRILKVESGGLVFYPDEIGIRRGIVFAATKGKDIKNVEITVLQSQKIQGKVQRTDGKPIANSKIELYIREFNLQGSSIIWTNATTDAEGRFEQHWDKHIGRNFLFRNVEGPRFYLISVGYEGRAAKPILVTSKAQTAELVFTLNTFGNVFNRGYGYTSSNLDAIGVWVVNPENGHAYKKISCKNPNDAIAQATKEGAHLVTINDGIEQDWLSRVYGMSSTFIGLSDIVEEGQWRWQNGEPVEYTNWAKGEPRSDYSKHEDYVILSGGEWKDIGPRSLQWHLIRTALIEKEKWFVKK